MTASSLRAPRLTFVGIGGMGVNTVGALDASVARFARRVAVDCDHATLRATPVVHTLQIGTALTDGQSTGGLADMGRRAANTDFLKLRDLFLDTDVAVLITGLGGGLGSGAAPMIAQTARDEGVLVINVVSLPFHFEGEQRSQQAAEALGALRARSDAVLTLPNDHLLTEETANQPLAEAFRRGGEQLGQGFRALWRLMGQPNLINLDFSHLKQALAGVGSGGTMLVAEGGGSGKVKLVLARLQDHPAVKQDRVLAAAPCVLLGCLGGDDTTLADVQEVVQGALAQVPTDVPRYLGVGLDPALRNRLILVVIAGQSEPPESTAAKDVTPAYAEGAEAKVPPPPAPPLPRKVVSARSTVSNRKIEQEELPLTPVSKGRFRDVEPTLYQGEDLDFPTFIRRGMKLSS